MHTLLFSSFFPHYQFWVVIDVWRRENFPIHTQRVEIVYEDALIFFVANVFQQDISSFSEIVFFVFRNEIFLDLLGLTSNNINHCDSSSLNFIKIVFLKNSWKNSSRIVKGKKTSALPPLFSAYQFFWWEFCKLYLIWNSYWVPTKIQTKLW